MQCLRVSRSELLSIFNFNVHLTFLNEIGACLWWFLLLQWIFYVNVMAKAKVVEEKGKSSEAALVRVLEKIRVGMIKGSFRKKDELLVELHFCYPSLLPRSLRVDQLDSYIRLPNWIIFFPMGCSRYVLLIVYFICYSWSWILYSSTDIGIIYCDFLELLQQSILANELKC